MEEEKTFEDISSEVGLEEVSDEAAEVDPEIEEEQVENQEEQVENQEEQVENQEDLNQEEEVSNESLENAIEAEFPNQEVPENDPNEDEKASTPEEESDEPVPAQPWIDFDNLDLKKDTVTLLKRPFYIIILVLGVLLLTLFIMMFIQYQTEEYARSLEGYVKTNLKAPEWHKEELPDDLKEFLRINEEKKKKIVDDMLIIHPDPNESKPIIGRDYPEAITNETLKTILKKQNIGEVTEEGVVKTELMNLSGLDLSKLNYKYFRNLVAANLRYAQFNDIQEQGLLFRGASLQYAQFVGAVIPRTNFIRAKLSYSNFFEAITDASLFENVIAEKAHFHGSRLVGSNFNYVAFLKSDFSNCNMDGISARYSNWEGTSFMESSLVGADFKDANLKGVSFVEADLTDVNFEGASLEGANFEGANLRNTNFKNTDVAGTSFKKVRNASFDQLNQAKFLLSANSIPEDLVPKKKSWKERFTVPHDQEYR